MASDMGRGGGYDYQWLLSLYLYTLMKNRSYSLDKNKKEFGNNFGLFASRLLRFKSKCIENYGADFPYKLEILVEGEESCLDDITFISESGTEVKDNIIFIQVKSKGGEESETITTSEGISKAIKNFLINFNFQRDKNIGNITFFIFCNKELSEVTSSAFDSKGPDLYLRLINFLCKNNLLNIYPSKRLNKLINKVNKAIILKVINGDDIFISEYLRYYSEKYLLELTNIINDLKLIFDNLSIVEKIDYDLLELELMSFYDELDFYRKEKRIRHLCWKGLEITKGTPEFERYEKYKNIYFHSQDGGKYIHEIDVITKGKFI